MNEAKAYKLTVENLELFDGLEQNVLFEITIKTRKTILNFLSQVSTLNTLLEKYNFAVPSGIILGGIIEIFEGEDNPRVTIGHEGDEYGNSKTVRQLDIYWEKVVAQ